MVGRADLRDFPEINDALDHAEERERRTDTYELAERFCRLAENIRPHQKKS